jgi:hypothetical protein
VTIPCQALHRHGARAPRFPKALEEFVDKVVHLF